MLKQLPWTGWPSGDYEVVMEIFVSSQELESVYGLPIVSFVEDGLGPCEATYFTDEVLGPVMIERFENSPNKAATVYVDSAIDLNVAVPRILEAMNLQRTEANIRIGY